MVMMMMMMSRRSVADDSHHQNVDKDDNKSFRIKHDDVSLFSRLLSRQQATTADISDGANSHSFRVYYADDDVSVPFVWESQPGTPKHRFSGGGPDAVLRPPLTPPPSYFAGKNLPAKKRNNLLRALLVKLRGLQKGGGGGGGKSSPPAAAAASPPYSSSSSSTSSTRSWFSASATSTTPPPSSRGRTRRQISSSGSGCSFENGIIIEEGNSGEVSPAACWGISNRRKRRSLSMH